MAGADSDNDGGANLLEYSQGSNPLLADNALWLPVSSPEVDNGNGTYSVEVPASLNADFLRLKVTTP